jgi:hypothetical protein
MAQVDDELKAFFARQQGGMTGLPSANRQNEGPISMLALSPRKTTSGFNKYGVEESGVFSPAAEMAKSAAPEVGSAVFGLNIINNLFDEADKMIPASKTPREGTVSGAKRWVARTPVGRLANMEDSEPARSYDSVKEGFGTMLARSLGEKGVVTNRDVSRILKMAPREDDTATERMNKKKFITKMIKDRISQYNEIVNYMGADFKGSPIQIAEDTDFQG